MEEEQKQQQQRRRRQQQQHRQQQQQQERHQQHEQPVVQYDQDFLFKVLVVGDFGVGKTAIVRRYTDGVFSQNYKITIGVDFLIKRLRWHPNKQITLQLWDIAGHERFGSLTRVYYKYATAAVLVYDLTRPATLESIVKWRDDLRDKTDEKTRLPTVLLANKCDISQDWPDLDRFCRQHRIVAWFPTSAKEDVNVDEALNFLVERILESGAADPPSSRGGSGGAGSSRSRREGDEDDVDDADDAGGGGAILLEREEQRASSTCQC